MVAGKPDKSSRRAELLEVFDEYKALSAKTRELFEGIIAYWGPEAQWTDEIRNGYQVFLDTDAELTEAFDAEIEKAGEDEDGSSQEEDGQPR